MKVMKKLGCAMLIAGMFVGAVGCGKNDDSSSKSNQEQNISDNMICVGYETVDDVRNFYFIDGNGNLQTYSGYNNMKDFKNGFSIVDIKDDNFSGQALIDAAKNEIVRGHKIKETIDASIPLYIITDDNDKLGIYSYDGEKISECKYKEVFTTDLTISGFDHAIVAKYEDTSVDIFSYDGQFIYNVPAGYATKEYGYSGISTNAYMGDANIIEVKYGDIVKLFDARTGAELELTKFQDYSRGCILTDEKLTLLDENYEVVKELDFKKEGKTYTECFRTEQNYYFAKYEDGKNTIRDVYNSNGELIVTDNSNKIAIETVSIGNKEYIVHIKDNGKSYLDENGKEAFFCPSGTQIEECNVNGFFVLKNDDGVMIYNTSDFKPYDNVLYKFGGASGLFFKEDYYMFNEEGNLYTMKKTEGVDIYDYRFLNNGYITYFIIIDNEQHRYILDVNGNGEPVEVPFGAYFCENVPCYKVDNVYYDYDGKVIYDKNK